MAPSPPKTTTSSKGKCYKGIPTKHSYKKIRRSVPPTKEGQNCPVPISVHCSHAGRSSKLVSPLTIKREVLEFSPPHTSRPSASSSMSEPRVFVETVVLDSDSSDSEDNVVLSTLLHCKVGSRSCQSPPREASPPKEDLSRPTDHGQSFAASSSPHASPQASLPNNEDDARDETDEDYVPGTEEMTVPEDSLTFTEDPSVSHHTRTSKPSSTEGSGEFSTLMSPHGHVGSSSGSRRPPVRGQRVILTQAGRRKIPPNVPSMPIDGVSFHS
uniref:Flocculation protein FLO11-like n=1 Tax=Cucumis melo TaxID=3656 RepID=A0A9I9D523_CUCME